MDDEDWTGQARGGPSRVGFCKLDELDFHIEIFFSVKTNSLSMYITFYRSNIGNRMKY